MNSPQPDELRDSIASYLREQGLAATFADSFSKVVLEEVLTWQPGRRRNPDECKAILAFSFGYQLEPNGNRRPGPVNEALANAVLKHYARRPRPVYAQCEVADLLTDRLPPGELKPIYPKISARTGAVRYLGTDDMVAQVVKAVGEPNDSDPWLIIAHRHHAVRCSLVARGHGLSTIAPADLPDLYDLKSAQPWRRRHLEYMISDVITRLTMLSANQLFRATPGAEEDHPTEQDAEAQARTECSDADPQAAAAAHSPSLADDASDSEIGLAALNDDPVANPSLTEEVSYEPRNRRQWRREPSIRIKETQDDTSQAAEALLQRLG